MPTSPTSTKNTTMFYAQAAISFGIALIGVTLGICYLPVDAWMRAFLALGALYLVTSAFTLAKCVRDAQESGSVISRLDEARLERLLAEFDPYRAPTLPAPHGPMSAQSTQLAQSTQSAAAPRPTYTPYPA
jgi:hypothetical protein